MDQYALGVDVRNLQLRPFPQAQPTRIDHLQTHAGFRALYQGQQGAHFLGTQHNRQFLAGPGTDELEHRPRALQRVLVEEPDSIEVDASRALRALLFIDQVEEVLPDLPFTDLIGSPPVVLREVFNGFNIALLSLGANPRSCRSSSIRRLSAVMVILLVVVTPMGPSGQHESGR